MEKYFQGFAVFLACISAVLSCQGGTLLDSGISDQDRSIILQEHNRLRATVAMGRVPNQPGAENMREMVWDDELAARAQQWANNCQFKHDPHRTIDRFTMGQNMAIIWSTADIPETDGDFPSRIQSWFNEVQKYTFGSAWSLKTGHYSQLVWGETNLVGCGFAYYKDSKKFNKLYVCNYGPGGNVVGDNPYEVGRPACKNYGMKPSYQYQGLCSSPPAQQNSIDTTFTFKSTSSYTNSKTSYNGQYLQTQPQPQQQQLQSQPQQQQQQQQTRSYQSQQQQNGQYQRDYQNSGQYHPQYHSSGQYHPQKQTYSQTQQQSTGSLLQTYEQPITTQVHVYQQQIKKPVNPNFDYSFKSFFKQVPSKKPNYDWQK